MPGGMTSGRIAASIRDEVQFAVFKTGGGEYALNIMRIMEIIRPMKVTEVPKAPEFVKGIINLRGMIVPILDMRERFGLPKKEEDKKTRIIILKLDECTLGVVVDEVTEVLYLANGQVDVAPDAVKGPDAEYISGVGKVGDRLIIILDVGKLLTKEEIKGLSEVEEALGADGYNPEPDEGEVVE